MIFTKINHSGQLKYGLIEILEPIEAEMVDSDLDRKKIPDELRTLTNSGKQPVHTLPDTVPAQL